MKCACSALLLVKLALLPSACSSSTGTPAVRFVCFFLACQALNCLDKESVDVKVPHAKIEKNPRLASNGRLLLKVIKDDAKITMSSERQHCITRFEKLRPFKVGALISDTILAAYKLFTENNRLGLNNNLPLNEHNLLLDRLPPELEKVGEELRSQLFDDNAAGKVPRYSVEELVKVVAGRIANMPKYAGPAPSAPAAVAHQPRGGGGASSAICFNCGEDNMSRN